MKPACCFCAGPVAAADDVADRRPKSDSFVFDVDEFSAVTDYEVTSGC